MQTVPALCELYVDCMHCTWTACTVHGLHMHWADCTCCAADAGPGRAGGGAAHGAGDCQLLSDPLAAPQPPPGLHPAVPARPLRPLQDPSHLPGYHTEYRHCESLCLCLCKCTCLSLHLSVFTHTCAGMDSSFHSGPTIPSRTLYRR